MPTSFLPSTIGMPETFCSFISSCAFLTGWPGDNVTGSRITPCSERLTLATSRFCASTERFLWIMPIPPSWASAIASAASVTVSIAAETIGIFIVILSVNCVRASAWLGTKSLWAGNSSTSSKVIPSATILLLFIFRSRINRCFASPR
ncbi:hypothetical protein ES703_72165 [subsurface metagenome]